MLDNAIPQGFEDAVELRRKNRETVVKYMNTKGQDRLRRHELFVEDGCEHKTSNWSAIWVLPLVALAIGAWLAWRAFDQAGVDIQVRFESGDGIQANKTEVLYKGISVGKVTDLHVSKDIKGVVATIEIKKEAQEYLSKDTRFWLVKPRVSLAGVTGLAMPRNRLRQWPARRSTVEASNRSVA